MEFFKKGHSQNNRYSFFVLFMLFYTCITSLTSLDMFCRTKKRLFKSVQMKMS